MAALLATLVGSRAASAGPSYQVPIGPRAIGMGGAFGAVADDATAIYWNPAGLPQVGHQVISATHADLFGSGITDNYASFVLPLSLRQAVAADWYHSGFDDTELGFGENRIQLAFGRRFHELISAGFTAKYLSRNTDLDGASVRSGTGFGLDLGLIAHPRDNLRLAFSIQDVADTKLNYSDGEGSAVAFPHLYRGGLAYEPHRDLTLAFDSDDRWHAGAELRTLGLLALRVGLQKDWRSTDDLIWSAGTGIRAGMLRFDYALVDHPTLGSTHHFGMSLEFNFNPAQVRIEKAESRDIYASLLKSYARDPITTVRLSNLDTDPITAKVGFFVPELMTVPSEQEVVLRPKATQDVAVTAVLSERVLEGRGDRPVQASVSVTYQSHRLPRTERRTSRFIAYGPGAIDWSAGTDQAAAFVTPLDPAVNEFARRAVRSSRDAGETLAAQRNLANMAAIVDALAVVGVAYVPDPNNPFSTISETPRAVDTIAYPSETLARGTGDCDDTSVLVAALLGNVGIATQFVDVPGHLFLLADTGVHERHLLALGLEESRFVVADETVWIPIETTALGKGFTEAWRLGLEAYTSWDSRGRVRRVDVADASSRYEPARPTAVADRGPAFDAGALESRLRQDMETVAAWRAAYMASRFGNTGKNMAATPEALNELARVYFMSGRVESAGDELERALEREPDSPRTLNNLANVRVAQGDMRKAVDLYQASVRRDSADAGVWLNLGLVRYVSGDSVGAYGPLAHGLERSGGYAEACRLLGLAPDPAAMREGSQRMTADEVRSLLKAALRKVPPTPARKTIGAPSAPDSLPPGHRWVSRVAGGRAGDAPALYEILYWR